MVCLIFVLNALSDVAFLISLTALAQDWIMQGNKAETIQRKSHLLWLSLCGLSNMGNEKRRLTATVYVHVTLKISANYHVEWPLDILVICYKLFLRLVWQSVHRPNWNSYLRMYCIYHSAVTLQSYYVIVSYLKIFTIKCNSPPVRKAIYCLLWVQNLTHHLPLPSS